MTITVRIKAIQSIINNKYNQLQLKTIIMIPDISKHFVKNLALTVQNPIFKLFIWEAKCTTFLYPLTP